MTVPATVFQNRGNILHQQGKYEEALDIFQATLDSAQVYEDLQNQVNALNNLGASHEELGNDEIAIDYYLRALQQYQAQNAHWGTTNTLGNIRLFFLKKEDYDQALNYAAQSLAMARTHQFPELELLVLYMLRIPKVISLNYKNSIHKIQ